MADNSGQFKKGHVSWNAGTKGTGITKYNGKGFQKGLVPHNKTEHIVKVCKCGKQFSVPPCLNHLLSCSLSCGHKGISTWNKGKELTPEHKEKLRQAKLGIRGPEHWNYRGYKGRTERKVAMAQDEYKQWRKAVFERDDYTCQECAVRGVYLEADHIQPWVHYPELRYNIDNGRTLCRPCHQKTPTWGSKTKLLERVG